MDKYIETLYLIGCYLVVADREINILEVEALDNILQDNIDDELLKLRNEIFSDEKNKPDYHTLLNQLMIACQSREQKERAIRYLVQVAFADGYYGETKKKLINDVSTMLYIDSINIVKEEEQLLNDKDQSSRMNRIKRLWGNVQKIYYDNFADQQKQSTLNKIFGGTSFQLELENITDQAQIDYHRICHLMASMDKELRLTREKVSSLSKRNVANKKDLQEIQKFLCEVNDNFNNLIDVHLAANKEILEKKQRNIRYFTIAFMGRTKAGKSTLHKVMTMESNDDIGAGRLRTTRYNRSWLWDKLRVIDTPGIGAPGGEVDTEIAKSIIDEADLICYVVTNDSIQETEFDFFDQIKEHNKPLYIVLNVKSNLLDSKRLEKFLENSSKWKDTQGRESLQGHIDRIHDKLDGKYNMNAVKIIPIHLLAAQLSVFAELDKEKSDILLNGSNIREFSNSIKKEVYNSGCLKKSLSVIEGSAYQIHNVRTSIENDRQTLINNQGSLKNVYARYKRFINTESEKLKNDVRSAYESAGVRLHNRAASFAAEHYDDKQAGDKWNSDLAVKSILNELNSNINTRIKDFTDKVKDELQEFLSDISESLDTTASSGISGDSIFNTRLCAGVFGTIITIATPFLIPFLISNPAGWIVALITAGVGIIITFFTLLFTSKEEKIRKATEDLRRQLDDEIDKSITKCCESGLEHIGDMVDNLRSSIETPFDIYIKGIDDLIDEMQVLVKGCDVDEAIANSLIGFRILEFIDKSPLKDKKISEINNDELIEKYPTVRDWEKHTLVYCYPIDCSLNKIEKAEAATQMNILIK